MKKFFLAIAAVAMLFATSCKNNNEPENIVLGENEFLATIDNGANPQNAPIVSDGNSPKTTIDGNRYVIWDNGDKISINGVNYTTSTSGNSVVFSGTGATGTEFHAFYPASIAGSGAAGTLSATQTYETDKVSNLPMYAYSTSHQLTFNNICAVLKIVVPSYVNGASSIEVSSDQRMNGAFTVDANNTAVMSDAPSTDDDKKVTIQKENSGTFATNETVYIAVPATSYTNLKIKFVGGASAWEKTLASCTLEVNKIYPINMTENYFCFTALAASTVSFSQGSLLQYSTNGTSWTTYANQTIQLAQGAKVYFKANKSQQSLGYGDGYFSGTGSLKVSGNIMYLLDPTGTLSDFTSSNEYAFMYLFNGMTSLTDASQLCLPATTLADGCYSYMFDGCSSLTTAPALPATTLASGCYSDMFNECSSLTTAPALPATTLVDYCYSSMFYECSSLTTAPALPATTLADDCYSGMFYKCSSLTTAPALPATTLTSGCYSTMFRECSSLTTAPALPATTVASYCYSSMFYGCSSLTTAPAALPATTLASDCYAGMFYGCSSLTTAPELPASTLTNYCYVQMFGNCSKLSSVTMKATSFGQFSLAKWLENAGTESGCAKIIYTANQGVADWFNTGDGRSYNCGWTAVYDSTK